MAQFTSPFQRWTSATLASYLGVFGLGLGTLLLLPTAAQAAEEIAIQLTGPLVLHLSLDDLETFVETGEVVGSFRLYARFLNRPQLDALRQILQQPLPLDVVTVSNLSYAPLGRDAIYNIGKVLQAVPGENGFYALRAAVLNAAAQAGPEGWTMMDALRAFPAQSIEVNGEGLAQLQRELSVYFSYNQAAIAAIQAEAATEAAAQTGLALQGLPDLSQPGPYSVERRTLTVTNPSLRQTQEGLSVNYDFDVDVYLPRGGAGAAPIVIVSHGFGATKEDFVFLNEHLASHGYVVVVPEHVGSDLEYRQRFLKGRLNTLLSPMEFINRPLEVSFLIDELERLVATSPNWASRLDLSRIAAIGDSLGSSTVIALAGAPLDYDHLRQSCDREGINLNFSAYLQCRARFLPPEDYTLRDSRIKAVIAAHNLGASLYSPASFRQIDIPVLMVSGDTDIVAPVLTEQIAPFIWLENDVHYLALMQRGTHFSSKPPGKGSADVPRILMGEHRDIGANYYKTLATAFLGAHLRGETQYLPYLSARYAQIMSTNQPMVVDLIRDLSAEQVEARYEGTLPFALVPTPAEVPSPRAEPILAAIARTGELRVAMRRDAPPFGYVSETGEWTGYCPALVKALQSYLGKTLKSQVSVDLVALPSTLSNRFDLVRQGQVYLECGPNSVQDVPGVDFSKVIFATGSHFLTTPKQASTVNPNFPLTGVDIGVLANSRNELFLREQYPTANVVTFEGPTARADAIAAVNAGDIAAFLGDDILTRAEVQRSNIPFEDWVLVPEDRPLSCEYYALALPNNDPEWQAVVNDFLESTVGVEPRPAWLGEFLPNTLEILDNCLNQ